MSSFIYFAILISICGIYYIIKNIGREEFELENLKNGLKQKEIETNTYKAKLRQIDKEVPIINTDGIISSSDASSLLSGGIQQPSKGSKATST